MTFIYSSDTGGRIGLSSVAQMSGVILKSKKFGNFTSGGTININLFEPVAPPASNLSAPLINSTNQSTNTSTQAPLIQNFTISQPQPIQQESFFAKIPWKPILLWIVYVIGAIVGIFIIYLLVRFIIKKVRSMPPSTSSKGDLILKHRSAHELEKELYEAERKIREAQQTIDFIKNKKQRAIEAQKKFDEAKRELENLKDY